MYEEYGGFTFERVWQSLFKVYNQTLRKWGDNDLRLDHTGVSARQRAVTLETIVTYDAEAFSAVWVYLASSDNVEHVFNICISGVCLPLGEGRNTAIFCRLK